MSVPGNTPPSTSRWGRTAALRDSYRGWRAVLPVLLGLLIVFGVLALLFWLPGRSS
jgi:hypothetical protein